MDWPPAQPFTGTGTTTTAVVIEPETQSVQAAAEGAAEGIVLDDGDYIEFFGEHFRLADRVGIMPLLAFANASKGGLDSSDVRGMAAMYSLIRSVIHRPPAFDEHGKRAVDPETGKPGFDETEWTRFEDLAMEENADDEDVMDFVNQAMEVMSARPRKRREISSGGSPRTSEKSKESSSSPGTPPGMDGLVLVRDVGR